MVALEEFHIPASWEFPFWRKWEYLLQVALDIDWNVIILSREDYPEDNFFLSFILVLFLM